MEDRIKILKNNISTIYCNTSLKNDTTIHKLANRLRTLEVRDNPDGIIMLDDNECIIIEHFEIDASKHTKKGSTAKRELGRITRDWEKEHELAKYSDSKENLISSLVKLINKHNKFDIYRDNLIKEQVINKETIVHNILFIEDRTLLVGIKDNKYLNSCILFDREILKILEEYTDIDYIISINNHLLKMKEACIIKNNDSDNYDCPEYDAMYFDSIVADMTFIKLD